MFMRRKSRNWDIKIRTRLNLLWVRSFIVGDSCVDSLSSLREARNRNLNIPVSSEIFQWRNRERTSVSHRIMLFAFVDAMVYVCLLSPSYSKRSSVLPRGSSNLHLSKVIYTIIHIRTATITSHEFNLWYNQNYIIIHLPKKVNCRKLNYIFSLYYCIICFTPEWQNSAKNIKK